MDDERNGDQYYVCHDCKSAYRKCEVYSRVVGYLRPIDGWNKGKQEEFLMRKTYKIKGKNESLESKSKRRENV